MSLKKHKIQVIKMRYIKVYLFTALIIFFSAYSDFFAAGDETLESVMRFMAIITVLMVALIFWLVMVYAEKEDNSGDLFFRPFKNFMRMLTKSTPIEQEKDIMFDHDFDGIQELDNKIPPWFTFLFYGTIVFSIIYMISFHMVGSGDVQREEYMGEIKQAQMERELLIRSGAFLNEETVTLATDAATLSNGKDIYLKNCASCHANDGGGLVGPNLTDNYWIHGGGIKNVFKTIKYGVPAKGMISWQTQLNPTQIKEVGSFIISLEGTVPAVPKAPEGTIWTETPENSDTNI